MVNIALQCCFCPPDFDVLPTCYSFYLESLAMFWLITKFTNLLVTNKLIFWAIYYNFKVYILNAVLHDQTSYELVYQKKKKKLATKYYAKASNLGRRDCRESSIFLICLVLMITIIKGRRKEKADKNMSPYVYYYIITNQ